MKELKSGVEIVLDALPGTTRDIVQRTGLSPSSIRRLLRTLIDKRIVESRTRWIGPLAHTNVYRRVPL